MPEVRLVRADGQSGEVPALQVVAQGAGLNWLTLDGPLDVGARYRLEVDGDCGTEPVEFAVTKAAELPKTLGTLDLTPVELGAVEVGTISGSCSIDVAAVRASTKLQVSEEAAPWQDLLWFATQVDEAPFVPSASNISQNFLPESSVTVFAECPGLYAAGRRRDEGAYDTGLSEGAHAIVLEARVPGEAGTLATSPVTVALDCPSSGAVLAGVAAADNGTTNGAVEPGDTESATPPESTDSAEVTEEPRQVPVEGASSGCSLHGARHRAGHHALWLLFAALAFAWARARSRR